MNQRPEGSCCGNCGAWEESLENRPVELGKNEHGSIFSWSGNCHMLPNPVETLANHFCFMWIEKEKESK